METLASASSIALSPGCSSSASPANALAPKTGSVKVNGTLTPPPENATAPTSTIELCIAHFNEELSWLSPLAQNTTIYSKGNPPEDIAGFAHATQLPNIGRETHTYLTHIVKKYESLPYVTLFLQGNIHDVNEGTPAHTDLTLIELISASLQLSPGAVLPIGLVLPFTAPHFTTGIPYKPDWVRRRGATLLRSAHSPASFWSQILFAGTPDVEVPRKIRFVQGACYAVTKEAILARPKWFWERLLRYFEELGEKNPEEGHFMERMWYAVFAPQVAIVDRG